MMYKKNKKHTTILTDGDNTFIGQSIEDKVRTATSTKAPIEAISPMIYTERKDGVIPDHNIRTDKWEIAQQAMDTISKGVREKRQERMNADKPNGNSEVNAPTKTN